MFQASLEKHPAYAISPFQYSLTQYKPQTTTCAAACSFLPLIGQSRQRCAFGSPAKGALTGHNWQTLVHKVTGFVGYKVDNHQIGNN